MWRSSSMITFFALLLGAWPAAWFEARGQQNSTTKAARPELDPLEMFADSEMPQEQQEARRKLEGLLKAAVEPLDKATAHAAMANWLLAIPAAAPATRWVLGLDRPEDRQILAESAEDARRHLSEARSLLKADEGEDNIEKARRKRLSSSLTNLNGFALVFLAAGVKGTDAARREAFSEAAAELSVARESEKADLASAATLWQVTAWTQIGRRERALRALPEVLARPEAAHDFLSRLLRCRILADEGQYSAALALCTQIRTRIEDWFPREPAARQQARERLVGLLQMRIGQVWMQKLSTQPAEAELLKGILVSLRQSLFPPGDKLPEIYTLERAIPILVEAPEVKAPGTAPAEEPATRAE